MSTEAAAQKRPVELEASWLKLLREEFDSDYMRQLRVFLREEKQSGRQVYPPGSDMFNALNSTPFDDVKIVILGQDPYHGEGQAHGLCFSVKPGVPVPPSLRNIYRELETDMGFDPPGHGFLQSWAQQGVLLLNSVLTVRANQAGSHQGKGWERFTDRIVALLSQHKEALVFLLWPAPCSAVLSAAAAAGFARCAAAARSRRLRLGATSSSLRRLPIVLLPSGAHNEGQAHRHGAPKGAESAM